MNKCVLDASAVLAYLNAEPGRDHVARHLDTTACHLSAANYIEVLTRLIDHGMPTADAVAVVAALNLTLAPLDAALAQRSAELRHTTRSTGLSLGDRVCLALAERETCPAITADRAWLALADKLGIAIELIRPVP